MIANYDSLTLPLKPEIHLYDFDDVGFGDTLNHISYIYTNAIKPIKVFWHRNEYGFDKVKVITSRIYKPCPLVTHIKRPLARYPYQYNRYCLYNHKYWPTRVKRSENKTYKIAVDFYTAGVLNGWNNVNKITPVGFTDLVKDAISENGYEPIQMYHLNAVRGGDLIISNASELVFMNLNILKQVDAYIGVEGGIGHLCRAMNIPCLFYHKKGLVLDKIVLPYLNSMQVLKSNLNDFLEYIPVFLKNEI